MNEDQEKLARMHGLLEEALGSVYSHIGYSESLSLNEYLLDLAERIENEIGLTNGRSPV